MYRPGTLDSLLEALEPLSPSGKQGPAELRAHVPPSQRHGAAPGQGLPQPWSQSPQCGSLPSPPRGTPGRSAPAQGVRRAPAFPHLLSLVSSPKKQETWPRSPTASLPIAACDSSHECSTCSLSPNQPECMDGLGHSSEMVALSQVLRRILRLHPEPIHGYLATYARKEGSGGSLCVGALPSQVYIKSGMGQGLQTDWQTGERAPWAKAVPLLASRRGWKAAGSPQSLC